MAEKKRKAHLRRRVKQMEKEASKFINSVLTPSSVKKNDGLKNKTSMDNENETGEVVNKIENLMKMIIETPDLTDSEETDVDEEDSELEINEKMKHDEEDKECPGLPALCQNLLKSTAQFSPENDIIIKIKKEEFGEDTPNLTDTEETDDEDSDFEIDSLMKMIIETPDLTDSEEMDDDDADSELEINEIMKHDEEDKECPGLPALCQNLLKSTAQFFPKNDIIIKIKKEEFGEDIPNLTDTEETDDEDSDFEGDEVNENDEKYMEEKKECPDLSALCQTFKFFPDRNRWFLGIKPIGLKGGANRILKQQAKMGIKLVNNRNEGTRNICFVNSVVQLFRMTGFATFILTQLPPLLDGHPISSYKGCRALLNLYSEQTARERSAAFIRKCVAQHSGKQFLNNGSQQDAEEFLGSLVAMVSAELANFNAFSTVQSNHWGSEQFRRVFLDNPPDGSCKKCGQYPSSRVDEFLSLKLTIPISALNVNLSSIIDDYFSESTETIRMKCTNCCPHEKEKVVCTQTGFCSRPAATHSQLTKSPKFLFLHLLRFGNGVNGPKVNTLVKFEDELVLPNGYKYEVLGALCHRGMTIRAGHYVTFIKSESDQWLLFDDTHIQSSSLDEANNQDNYILLFKQKVTDLSESAHDSEVSNTESPVIAHEDSCEINVTSINTQDEVVEVCLSLDKNKLKPDDVEISPALCQNNTNTNEKHEEGTQKGMDNLTALSQNNKKNSKTN